MTDQDYIPVLEAAARAKVSHRTIYRWIGRGWIPAFGNGNATRVRMADVLRPKHSKCPTWVKLAAVQLRARHLGDQSTGLPVNPPTTTKQD